MTESERKQEKIYDEISNYMDSFDWNTKLFIAWYAMRYVVEYFSKQTEGVSIEELNKLNAKEALGYMEQLDLLKSANTIEKVLCSEIF